MLKPVLDTNYPEMPILMRAGIYFHKMTLTYEGYQEVYIKPGQVWLDSQQMDSPNQGYLNTIETYLRSNRNSYIKPL